MDQTFNEVGWQDTFYTFCLPKLILKSLASRSSISWTIEDYFHLIKSFITTISKEFYLLKYQSKLLPFLWCSRDLLVIGFYLAKRKSFNDKEHMILYHPNLKLSFLINFLLPRVHFI